VKTCVADIALNLHKTLLEPDQVLLLLPNVFAGVALTGLIAVGALWRKRRKAKKACLACNRLIFELHNGHHHQNHHQSQGNYHALAGTAGSTPPAAAEMAVSIGSGPNTSSAAGSKDIVFGQG
jgi:hypothetical protein